jgi:ATP-dependent RNA helicase DeaD
MNLPTVDAVNALRIAKFKQRVTETMAGADVKAWRPMVEQLEAETGLALVDIAAALASLAQGTTPLLLGGRTLGAQHERGGEEPKGPPRREATFEDRNDRPRAVDRPRERATVPERPVSTERSVPAVERAVDSRMQSEAPRAARPRAASGLMETFRIEVGAAHGIKPSNVVGAIASEAGIEGVHIGRVDIRDDHSYVDLPEGMPKQIFKVLQKVLVAGRELRITKVSEKPPKPPRDVERKMLTRKPAAGRTASD